MCPSSDAPFSPLARSLYSQCNNPFYFFLLRNHKAPNDDEDLQQYNKRGFQQGTLRRVYAPVPTGSSQSGHHPCFLRVPC